jgi:hypothetical protein
VPSLAISSFAILRSLRERIVDPVPSPKPAPTAEPSPNPKIDKWFERLQVTVLGPKCATCHQPPRPKHGIDLTTYETVMSVKGLVVPNNPEKSLLYQIVAADEMPPRNPLDAEAKSKIFKWIAAGAPKEVELAEPIEDIVLTSPEN